MGTASNGLPDLPPEWGKIYIPDDAAELDAEAELVRKDLKKEVRPHLTILNVHVALGAFYVGGPLLWWALGNRAALRRDLHELDVWDDDDVDFLRSPLYVGDTERDESAASEARVAFVHARYGFGNTRGEPPAVDSFDELVQLILTRTRAASN